MKRVPRRLFTEEFKKEAIKLVKEQHWSYSQIWCIENQAAFCF